MNLNNTNILVTGGAGFVGSHIVDECISRQGNLFVLDDYSEGVHSNLENAVKNGAMLIEGDIRDYKLVNKVISENAVEVVFHLAADASVPRSVEDPVTHLAINVHGTTNILTSSVRNKVKKVIFASSASVYGIPQRIPMEETDQLNPVSPYGASKLAGEKLGVAFHASMGLPFIAFRILNAYGPRQRHNVKYDFLRKLKQDPSRLEVLGTGRQVRDYIYASDVARAFVMGAESEINCGVYNIASGIPTSIRKVADILVSRLSIAPDIRYTGKSWPGDVDSLVGNNDLIRQDLGWKPEIEFEDGVEKLIQWFRETY